MRAKAIITPPWVGIVPPLSPVPAPRPTSGRPCSRQILTMATTSSVVFGKTTHSGRPFSMLPSYSYSNKSCGAVEHAARSDGVAQSC